MRPRAALDLEVFSNYFLFMMMDLESTRVIWMEHPLDIPKIIRLLKTYTLITFNGLNYDIPILMYALTGVGTEAIKRASNRIIQQNLKPWNFAKEFNVNLTPPGVDHIDLMEVAPLKGSLKLYGARMHCRVLQELPVHETAVITDEQRMILREYCENDLRITVDLAAVLKTQIDLRVAMSAEYGVDLRSKSDAQIAEHVVKTSIETRTKTRLDKPVPDPGARYHYQVPDWIRFPTMPHLLDEIRAATFLVNDAGHIVPPAEISKKVIALEGNSYKFGVGGLHSRETSVAYRATSEYQLYDRDVTSYYPSILLNQKLAPFHIDQAHFLAVYQKLVTDRIAAKKAGNVTVAESLKICVNGLFGKFGSKYSYVYAPQLMFQITLTGQLALLMLIEAFAHEGILVMSANTDGVFVKCHHRQRAAMLQIVTDWEAQTGYVTEEQEYQALYARDVSNYIAVKKDGLNTKLKGVYGPGLPLQKNPVTAICAEAVIDYLTLDASIESTILCCRDPRRFVAVRQVNGGAMWRGKLIGKIARWYYATGVEEAITYKVNDHLVPKTYGAKPLPVLPETVPDDLNYDWYIRESYDILAEIGVAA